MLLYFAVVGEGDLSGYVLPKGHVEPGEEIETAARREIEEEAGLSDLRLLGELGVRERMDFRKTGWKKTHYFLYLTEQADGRPTDPNHDYALTLASPGRPAAALLARSARVDREQPGQDQGVGRGKRCALSRHSRAWRSNSAR